MQGKTMAMLSLWLGVSRQCVLLGRPGSNFSTLDRAQARPGKGERPIHALWCHHQAHTGVKFRAAQKLWGLGEVFKGSGPRLLGREEFREGLRLDWD